MANSVRKEIIPFLIVANDDGLIFRVSYPDFVYSLWQTLFMYKTIICPAAGPTSYVQVAPDVSVLLETLE
jgi:hypothetical protein